jgi:hypothetical protein
LKKLEQTIIDSMRAALAAFDTDHSVVRENMERAHNLFRDHEWSEEFYTLYNGMLEIYCSYTPRERGHYRRTSIGVGYSSFPVQIWVPDKIQPPKPTAIELVARFDALIHAWNLEHPARSGQRQSKSKKGVGGSGESETAQPSLEGEKGSILQKFGNSS